jgi:hypothetical protein
MLAKDCMESSKGAAGFRMKNEMASRGGFRSGTRKKGESPDWK